MNETSRMSVFEKIVLFRRYFSGLPHVYGTYDPLTRRSYTVQEPVTDAVVLNHLKGNKLYGVYLLVHDRTRAVAVDFDQLDSEPVIHFLHRARHYRLSAYIERSKSKGYHGWMFFTESGVPAAKARRVVQQILREIEYPHIEIFPKQDALTSRIPIGNFINAPLFGALVPEGRTVFVDPDHSLEPFPNQWEFLKTIQTNSDSRLDEIITVNELHPAIPKNQKETSPLANKNNTVYGLLPCAQRILQEGVTATSESPVSGWPFISKGSVFPTTWLLSF